MKKSHIATLLIFLVCIPATLIFGSRLSGRWYYATSTLVVMELLIPFFMAFEGRKPQARELVILAVLCALAVAARVAIPIPGLKAIFGVIMIAGIAFGPVLKILICFMQFKKILGRKRHRTMTARITKANRA